jgi:hypothetical protein
MTAPAVAAPGPATFVSRTTAEGAGWVGLARLEPGTSWEEFRTHLRDTVSDDPARIVRGSAALGGSAVLLGGAVIHPGLPGEFTVELAAGPHVLFDYPAAAGDGEPRYQLMDVRGEIGGRLPEATGEIVAERDATGRPGFAVRGNPVAGRPLAFANRMPGGQFVEAVLFPVGDDVTEETLAGYFAEFPDFSSEWPDTAPFDLHAGCGFLPLSPGRRAVNLVPARPGRHAVVNWMKDAEDGIRLAKRGQHRILTISRELP